MFIHVELFDFRHLKGEDISSLKYRELMGLEDALENGLTGIRDKQVPIIFLLSNIFVILFNLI